MRRTIFEMSSSFEEAAGLGEKRCGHPTRLCSFYQQLAKAKNEKLHGKKYYANKIHKHRSTKDGELRG